LKAVARKDPAEGGQEGPVGGPVLNATVKLALEHPDLVTEEDELDILARLARLAAPGRDHERQGPARPEVRKGKGHGP
jgi:hypothetical protein